MPTRVKEKLEYFKQLKKLQKWKVENFDNFENVEIFQIYKKKNIIEMLQGQYNLQEYI